MPTLTVYTRINCVACDATKRWLNKRDVPYEERELSSNQALLREAVETGITSAPLVLFEHDEGSNLWGGFSPDLLFAASQVMKEEK